MSKRAFERSEYALDFVTVEYTSQELCERIVEMWPSVLIFVPDQYKTQETCERAVEKAICIRICS